MARKWLIAALGASLAVVAPSGVSAQSAPASSAPCSSIAQCMAEGEAALAAPRAAGRDDPALDRQSYEAFLQACALGAGGGCYNAAGMAYLGMGTAVSQEVYEQLLHVGCQLEHYTSCKEASTQADLGGRPGEAWALLALAARLNGRHLWQEDGGIVLTPRLPDGRVALPPVRNLPELPEGLSNALVCAGYWQAIAPDAIEAAGWQAAARAAFTSWPNEAGETTRTVAEADQWIADQVATWADAEATDEYTQIIASRCQMGVGRLFNG